METQPAPGVPGLSLEQEMAAKVCTGVDTFTPTPSDQGGPSGPNSYDIRLGREVKTYNLIHGVDPSQWPHASGNEHVPFLDAKKDNPTTTTELDDSGLMLQPGRLYLMVTEEYTEAHNCVPMLEGRSSPARLGVAVHVTAGVGDNGFRGRWCLEVTATHPTSHLPRHARLSDLVPLDPQSRVASIRRQVSRPARSTGQPQL